MVVSTQDVQLWGQRPLSSYYPSIKWTVDVGQLQLEQALVQATSGTTMHAN